MWIPLRTLSSLALLIGLAPCLAAQEIVIGDPLWSNPMSEPPEQLPNLKRKPAFPLSAELGQVATIEYGLVTQFVDARGTTREPSVRCNHPLLKQAIETALPEWHVAPGRRDGRPEGGAVSIPVIFNPPSSNAGLADATPRLLHASRVYIPGTRAPTLRTRIQLDAAGKVTGIAGITTPDLQSAVQDAIARWRFAPARQGGKAVASEVDVKVMCQPMAPAAAGGGSSPIPETRVKPMYPYAMRRHGISGEVLLEFHVDVDGRVKNAYVLQSDNPAFDDPALEAIRQWTFKPGTQDGKPVLKRMQLPMVFDIDGSDLRGYRIEVEADQSKYPPELRYDQAPVVRSAHVPVYPYALRRDNVRGKATAVMQIGKSGHVERVKVLSADRPEFGHALAAALERFKFDPARREGGPVVNLLRFEQVFSERELPDVRGESLLDLEKKRPERIIKSVDALDTPLTVLSERPAMFPVGAPAEIAAGEAVLEFLVDTDGRVRLPRVKSASHEVFGYAAIQAASSWAFEPPTVKGKPVVVQVERTVAFHARRRAPTRSAPGRDAAP